MLKRNLPQNLKPATKALHADFAIEDGASVSPPIHQSVTYRTDSAEDFSNKAQEPFNDVFYARHGTPTSSRIAKVLAELEGAEEAMMFASGMAAITTTILALVQTGDHIIAQKNLYSSSISFLTKFLPKFGVDITLVDQQSIDNFEKAITPKTKLMLVETPANPLMKITDLKLISRLAKTHNVITICDNTFATPINQTPITLGIDLVVHSATKYIGGHHDLLAGCVVGTRELLMRIWDTSMDLGPTAAPFNSWLALRGIRTLKLRVTEHNTNALKVASYLEKHPKIGNVFYPGLSSHPQHKLAKQQMSGFGGMLSFDIPKGYQAGANFLKNLNICINAASLGGIDTLVVQPAVMFKARLTDAEIHELDITPGMIRMSVGIEDVNDILNDIDSALSKI
ncbi:MAG: aminotransferase class I/II-fold pyridoxal phosphate-dependent enzyme [Emcibacteraceae bacterium]|nr:aminotransferase class I/II-fold pyridoxal phosphate-dependent enzyme [Emcibacteraceae bacterium]